MTTPPLTHTVEGLMALVKSFGDITLRYAMGRASSFESQKAWEDVQSYAVWLVDATAVDAAAEALKGRPAANPARDDFSPADMRIVRSALTVFSNDLRWDRGQRDRACAMGQILRMEDATAGPSEPGAKP